MNLLELAERWERDRDTANKEYDGTESTDFEAGYAQAKHEDAKELRAAITEQPLSRNWREGAEKLLKTARNRYEQGFAYGRIKSADDLDNYHDEGRALLEGDADIMEELADDAPTQESRRNLIVRAKRIRKHLGGDSDEA